MSRFRRAALTATLVAAVGLASAVAVTAPSLAAAPPSLAAAPVSLAAASLPTAAVAMGDSFISGEGAGSYSAVVDVNGVSRTFPGWSAPNDNAYFCHRSPNASIFKANLPGISARFNIACSGGQPADMANDSNARAGGRQVASQLSQLRAVAQTHDIDVVLVGLGSNNSKFTFGDVATECAYRFIADAWTGWWEFWAYLNGPVEQDPCSASDLATSAEFAAATAETVAAVRQIVTTLDEIDADGQHRIVLQDYTNPLPFDYASKFYSEDGRTDTRDKFRALGSERYTGGCPAHRASLAAGHSFSAGLGTMVKSVHTTLTAEFPSANLVYLNVQQAFNGARLCEQSTSPTGALATPIRLMDGPTGVFLTSLSGQDKIDIQRIATACATYFQTCQESWHPNVAGHTVLGQCLAGAASTTSKTVSCVRSSTGAITIT